MSEPLADMDRLVEVLRLMGHGLRLAILRQLASGEQAVGDLAAATGQSLSLVSQQLALLRKAELVQTRRAAKQVFYSLAPARLHEVAQAIKALAGEEQPEKGRTAAPPTPNHRVGAAMFARITPRAQERG